MQYPTGDSHIRKRIRFSYGPREGSGLGPVPTVPTTGRELLDSISCNIVKQKQGGMHGEMEKKMRRGSRQIKITKM